MQPLAGQVLAQIMVTEYFALRRPNPRAASVRRGRAVITARAQTLVLIRLLPRFGHHLCGERSPIYSRERVQAS